MEILFDENYSYKRKNKNRKNPVNKQISYPVRG